MSEAITEQRDGDKGRYVLADPAGDSTLTYRLAGERMVIDHTFTPPALRGRGVAGQLVERAVADARARGWSVVPVCPYVKIKIDRSPALQDVLDAGWRG
jgi:predicted GNAT family acetyltransferase